MFNPNSTPEQVRIEGVDAWRIRLDEETDLPRGFELAAGEIASFRVWLRR
jgi:hypothetical protein